MKPSRVVLSIVLVLTIGFVSAWKLYADYRKQQLQEYEVGPDAFVILSKGQISHVIEITVLNANGQPLENVPVEIENTSLWERGITDKDGHAAIKVGPPEVLRVRVDQKVVLERPRAPCFEYPYVYPGLKILIIRKDK